jgi:hypothetical protein
MAIGDVLAGIQQAYKAEAWFDANPTVVLKEGQVVHLEQTGQYKIGDGTTQLSVLEFLGSSGEAAWGNITGDINSQTDLITILNAKEDEVNKVNDFTDPTSTTKYPSVKAAVDGDAATLSAANAYTDAAVTTVFRPVGGYDASVGTFPTVGSGTAGAVRRGDTYNVTVAGTLGGVDYDIGDNFYANTNNPGQTASNWSRFESNTQQATEVVRGTARIATQATIEDSASTNDTDIVTVKKFWLGILRFLTLYKDVAGGIVGLTGQEINFKNPIGTVTSYFANANSSSRTYTFQDRSGTIADNTDLALKANINARVFSEASNATPVIDIDLYDQYNITALAAGSTIGAPTGTAADGRKIIFRIKDNGTARSLAFNAAFRFSSDLAAPTTTVISKTFYLGFIYNAVDSKWDCIAMLNNF